MWLYFKPHKSDIDDFKAAPNASPGDSNLIKLMYDLLSTTYTASLSHQ
jgi:hypothetical protein